MDTVFNSFYDELEKLSSRGGIAKRLRGRGKEVREALSEAIYGKKPLGYRAKPYSRGENILDATHVALAIPRSVVGGLIGSMGGRGAMAVGASPVFVEAGGAVGRRLFSRHQTKKYLAHKANINKRIKAALAVSAAGAGGVALGRNLEKKSSIRAGKPGMRKVVSTILYGKKPSLRTKTEAAKALLWGGAAGATAASRLGLGARSVGLTSAVTGGGLSAAVGLAQRKQIAAYLANRRKVNKALALAGAGTLVTGGAVAHSRKKK
jgi:hypothetical protein